MARFSLKQYTDCLSHSQAFCPQKQLPPTVHPPVETHSVTAGLVAHPTAGFKVGAGLGAKEELQGPRVEGKKGRSVGVLCLCSQSFPNGILYLPKEQKPRRA